MDTHTHRHTQGHTHRCQGPCRQHQTHHAPRKTPRPHSGQFRKVHRRKKTQDVFTEAPRRKRAGSQTGQAVTNQTGQQRRRSDLEPRQKDSNTARASAARHTRQLGQNEAAESVMHDSSDGSNDRGDPPLTRPLRHHEARHWRQRCYVHQPDPS